MSAPTVLALDGIRRTFSSGGRRVAAVAGVSLSLARGETLGVVGESGSGKSTLGRIAVGLERADAGKITVLGQQISTLTGAARRQQFGHCQMVFQDPYSSLNPRLTVARQVGESLVAQGRFTTDEIGDRVAALFEKVGLKPEQLNRYPHEFSGGQRQRVAIARALAPNPEIVVADEPVSALDVTIQAQILDLLADVQESEGLAYLFISHDIAVVAHLCRRIAVMHRGRVVEFGTTDDIVRDARHPYTQSLLDAVPRLGRRRTGARTPPTVFPSPSEAERMVMVTESHGVLVV
ncbi:ATP-binding cassette domain-containing protein [Methylobrevis albus]|uniref:ABC transporter ATP-binding protein n=1 Tax=Methylobrevis albus TaxID=2793297 RepID=A0A931I302_9HYPH|nr:ATP-binding cassette domain-containing protein [Methylobrevis albus]MBH0238340.1 ABC transporter ATP-binding protein [Methylobrevis albus]